MPPIVIGGAIAAAGAVGAAAIGSSASKKAAAATTQAADRSAEVVERNYDRSAAASQPWQQGGLRAFDQVNAMLGIGNPPQGLPAQQPNAMAQIGGTTGGAVSPMSNWRQGAMAAQGGQPAALPQFDPYGTPINPGWSFQQPQDQQPAGPPADPQGGFRQYIENSDYGFRFGEGANQVNSGYAGAGTLQSGAAMKGLEDYRQNLQQGYRGEYMGALGNQQSLGLAAMQAQAGVGGNAANSLANIYQNQGGNLANVALVNGQNNAALVNSLGTIGSGIFGNSGPRAPQPVQYAANSLGGAPLRLY